MLSQLAAHAAGEAGAVNRRRIVFFLQGNGMMPEHLAPSGIRRSNDGTAGAEQLLEAGLADRELHRALEPLEPFKQRLALIQGLSNRVAYSDHSCEFGALGCCPKSRPHNATIDQVLAQALGGVFPHVALGCNDRMRPDNLYCFSASGPDQAVPIVCTPEEARRNLFGGVADDAGDAKTAFAHQANLLDFMADDVRRARGAGRRRTA